MAPPNVEEVVADAEERDGLEGHDGREVGGELLVSHKVLASVFVCSRLSRDQRIVDIPSHAETDVETSLPVHAQHASPHRGFHLRSWPPQCPCRTEMG